MYVRSIVIALTLHLLATNVAVADGDDLEKHVREYAAQQGITDKGQIEALVNELRGISQTKDQFAFQALKVPCADDLARLCISATTPADANACLQQKRDSVSHPCELALRNEFGGKPLKEPMLYSGVQLPAGSTFFYDPAGNVLGVIASAEVVSQGIRFKSGQIRFNQNGISVGDLEEDQVINGIKFSAGSTFFHENGRVKSGGIAEDTTIDGRVYKGGTSIGFYPSGKVQYGQPVGTEKSVYFREDGTIDCNVMRTVMRTCP